MDENEIPICINRFGHVWNEWKQFGDIFIWKDIKWGYCKAEIIQTRTCSVCGYTQVDKRMV